MTSIFFILLYWILPCVKLSDCQLLINVKNQLGEIVEETISANTSQDVVTLEFQRPDGSLISQLVHFSKEVQILKALVLGEEERGQSQYQVMCFVCHVSQDELISADAMSKLRQKNPGRVRSAETEKEKEVSRMELLIDLPNSAVISPHVAAACAEAQNSTYTSHKDIRTWASLSGNSLSMLLKAVHNMPHTNEECHDTSSLWSPCMCHLEMCVPWYPCGLKFCRANQSSLYRCGIKTCKKCYHFEYYVKQKQLCLWDE